MDKAPAAFRTITEAADELGVPAHVLRFWEGKFPQLRPMKRAGGRRLYRPEDLALLRGLRALLQEDGYTIKGVQKVLRDQGVATVRARGLDDDEADLPAEAPPPPSGSLHAGPAPAAREVRVVPADPGEPAGPLFEPARPAPAAGLALRRALARLETARAALNRVAGGP